jgi:hypothetical protein
LITSFNYERWVIKTLNLKGYFALHDRLGKNIGGAYKVSMGEKIKSMQ